MQRVLLVDTDAAEADIVAFLLGSHGFEVRLAESAARAHLAADGEPVDLLLVDERLPEARELACGVRALPGNAALVAVAIGDAGAPLPSEFDARLERPLGLRNLVTTLRQILRHESRRRRATPQPSTTRAA